MGKHELARYWAEPPELEEVVRELDEDTRHAGRPTRSPRRATWVADPYHFSSDYLAYRHVMMCGVSLSSRGPQHRSVSVFVLYCSLGGFGRLATVMCDICLVLGFKATRYQTQIMSHHLVCHAIDNTRNKSFSYIPDRRTVVTVQYSYCSSMFFSSYFGVLPAHTCTWSYWYLVHMYIRDFRRASHLFGLIFGVVAGSGLSRVRGPPS